MSDADRRRLLEIRQEQYRRACRRSFRTFAIEALEPFRQKPARHHHRIIAELEAVTRGEVLRLMVLAPPGSAKTTFVSRLYPAWRFASRPNLSIIGTSHTAELSETNSIYTQRYIREHTDLLGYSLHSESRANWECSNGGRYRAVGVGGAITGFRADVILIDDPIRGREDAESLLQREHTWDWFNADLLTRLKPTGAVVLVMTRWHEDDLAGRLLRSQPEQWRVLKLPAIAEENDPLGRLEGEPLWNDDPDYGYGGRLLDIYAEMERAGRLRDWFALYQGRPRPPEGTMFKPAEMPILEALPREMIWDQVRAWDLASSTTGDWTVGLKLAVVSDGQNVDFVVTDVHRMRGRPDEVRRAVRAIAEADGYGVKIWLPQDPAQAGMDQVQSYIHLLMGYAVEAERMTGNKVIRADAVASQCNIRKVGMLRGSWNALFADELASFPSGQHDDQVDALSLAFSKVAGVSSALRLWRRM